jgi:hypothetical protein
VEPFPSNAKIILGQLYLFLFFVHEHLYNDCLAEFSSVCLLLHVLFSENKQRDPKSVSQQVVFTLLI